MKHLINSLLVITLTISCSDNSHRLNDDNQSTEKVIDYQSIGNLISIEAQSILLSNVSKNMKEGGPVHTIDFCNLNASLLMDSVSKSNSVTVSRISEKNRNENNVASEFEIGILESLKTSNNIDTVLFTDNQVYYYKTIRLGMSACLKCHGIPETDIDTSTLGKIKEKYPNDRATNYSMGDFRGAWKIVFQK